MTTIRQQSPKLGKRKKPFEKAVTYEKKEKAYSQTRIGGIASVAALFN